MSQPLLRIRPPAGRLAVLGGIAAVIFGAWMALCLAGCWEVTKPSACLPGTPLPDLTVPRLWTLPRAGEPPSGPRRHANVPLACVCPSPSYWIPWMAKPLGHWVAASA